MYHCIMKKEYSLYLEDGLVKRLDQTIFPLKRSNVIHVLILEYLVKKNAENLNPDSTAEQFLSTKNGDVI